MEDTLLNNLSALDHSEHHEDEHEDHFDLISFADMVVPRDRAFSWDLAIENDMSGEMMAIQAIESSKGKNSLFHERMLQDTQDLGIAGRDKGTGDYNIKLEPLTNEDDVSDILHMLHEDVEFDMPAVPQSNKAKQQKPKVTIKLDSKTISSSSGATSLSSSSYTQGNAAKKSSSTSDLMKSFDNSNSIYLRHDLNQLDSAKRFSSTSSSINHSSSTSSLPATQSSLSSSTALPSASSSTSSTIPTTLGSTSGLLSTEFLKRSPHMATPAAASAAVAATAAALGTQLAPSLNASGISNIMNGLPVNGVPYNRSMLPSSSSIYGLSGSSSGLNAAVGGSYGLNKIRPQYYSDILTQSNQAVGLNGMSRASLNMETSPYMVQSLSSLTGLERRVGAYTVEERRIKIEKFRERKRQRIWRKQIKYDCRKRLADTRPRVKGRFVSRKNMGSGGDASGDKDYQDGMDGSDDEDNSMGSGGMSSVKNQLTSSTSMQSLHNMHSSLSPLPGMQSSQGMQNITGLSMSPNYQAVRSPSFQNLQTLQYQTLSQNILPSLQVSAIQNRENSSNSNQTLAAENTVVDLEMTIPSSFLDVGEILGNPVDENGRQHS